MKLTDGKATIEITMTTWDAPRACYTPDISANFFADGHADYDRDVDAYIVADLDYCIEQARAWAAYAGDYADDDYEGERSIDITYLHDHEPEKKNLTLYKAATNGSDYILIVSWDHPNRLLTVDWDLADDEIAAITERFGRERETLRAMSYDQLAALDWVMGDGWEDAGDGDPLAPYSRYEVL